ncbi:MAG: hypothetical protein HAW66_09455 [Shewanella sp.]|nr:hypothetical protein [Shewanella sp.]
MDTSTAPTSPPPQPVSQPVNTIETEKNGQSLGLWAVKIAANTAVVGVSFAAVIAANHYLHLDCSTVCDESLRSQCKMFDSYQTLSTVYNPVLSWLGLK